MDLFSLLERTKSDGHYAQSDGRLAFFMSTRKTLPIKTKGVLGHITENPTCCTLRYLRLQLVIFFARTQFIKGSVNRFGNYTCCTLLRYLHS